MSGGNDVVGKTVALERLGVRLLRRLREGNPEWDITDLARQLGLPSTGLVRGLAEVAGFKDKTTRSVAEENRILRAFRRGIFGAQEVARETKLPLRKVEKFIERVGVPYGAGEWGEFPWPGKRGAPTSDREPRPAPRRVSRKGQLSYHGRLYGMGMMYAGEVGWVREEGGKLVVRFARKPPVALHGIG